MGFQQVSLVNLLRKPIETKLKHSFPKNRKSLKNIDGLKGLKALKTIEIENAKQLVGKDLNKYIQNLEKKMQDYASKLEFEEAAQLRDEINRLKAKQLGVPNKILELNR